MISGNLNLKQLEALCWVADLGSFRKAAKHLNTTQPNISARIAALEASLGVTLMQRDAGSVQMTPKGAALLDQARLVLRSAETMLEIAARPDLVADRLRLGVTEMVADTWLRLFIRRMKQVYPNVAIELTIDLSRSLDNEFSANNLDLTIQTAPFSSAATGVIELGSYEFIWVAAPDIATKLSDKLSSTDLLHIPILTHARHTQAYLDLVEYFEGHTKPRPKFVPSSSLTSGLHMAVDGMGVAVVPRAMAMRYLADGSLLKLDVDWAPRPLRFAARYQVGRSANFVAHSAQLAADTSEKFRATLV